MHYRGDLYIRYISSGTNGYLINDLWCTYQNAYVPSPFPHSADFSQLLRLRYNISPRFRHWSSMVDDYKRGPILKRAAARRVKRARRAPPGEEEDIAAGLTLLSLPPWHESRLTDLWCRSGEFCVYKVVASHLRRQEIRNICLKFSQPASSHCIFT